ncbi:heparinase II/III family protein [Spirosoma rhododendri]|uniref:Heparin-sulfate lyase N-terminal domain-containing protein n=1 Tax=Spirosoma rhododendri TaxID=2728024 RepID=A0A7L5DG93_9BACT|nr:alginate lyase family protein [Spirosoma rhododendri]QJD77234.1 hypothetical protein HH216_01465 [Spirosoma rhododendri]
MTTLRWFYNRLRSMSPAELAFRAQQSMQKRHARRRMGWLPFVRLDALPPPLLPFDPAQTPPVHFSPDQPVFRHTQSIDQPIDWHLDISTGKRFPLLYAHDVDVRTGNNGSAKYAWEINRLLFLPQLAVQYRQTGDRRFLDQLVATTISWQVENPYLTGLNWYSNIEVNIRLLNWFVCWNILDASALAKTDPAFGTFVDSCWVPLIYQHCTYSRANPSYFSSANNHLIAEYAGLFVAATFWQFPESADWEAYARKGLETEIVRQHSAQGINREEAAEYIQFITDFFLLAQVTADRAGKPLSATYQSTLHKVLTYIAQFLDVNGTFPRYGDEDDGRVLMLDEYRPFNNFRSLLASGVVLFGDPFLKQRAEESAKPGFDLKNYVLFGKAGRDRYDAVLPTTALLGSVLYPGEGHFIFRKQTHNPARPLPDEIYIHADAAPLGYLSIAAHGHADALSFLLHIDGCVFLADPGTYSYQTDPLWRNYFISTRAHNTVCFDGQNQARQAGAMLWLDQYKPLVLNSQSDEQADELTATHNGYRAMRCQHTRSLRFEKDTDTLLIIDYVSNLGKQARQVEIVFHFGPAIRIGQAGQTFNLIHPDTPRRLTLTVASALNTECVAGQIDPVPLGWYSDGFYHREPSPTLRTWLTLLPGQSITLRHRLTVGLPTAAPALQATDSVELRH